MMADRHGRASSYDRYSYTQNDPVNFTDPTGLRCKDYF
jgi:RHS repeat-associated protein